MTAITNSPRIVQRPTALRSTKNASRSKITGNPKLARLNQQLRQPVQIKGRVLWDSPLASYYLLTAATVLLSVLGLVMVLSSSTVASITAQKSPYSQFFTQGTYALIGLGALLVAAWLPIRFMKRLAWPAFILAFALQVLTLPFSPVSLAKGGNYGWIYLPVIGRMQPAEFGKLALAVWLGYMLGKRQKELGYWRAAFAPALGAVLLIGLVMGGKDLGTGLVVMLLIFGAFFVAGTPSKLLGAIASGAVAVIGYFFIYRQAGGNRVARIFAAYDPNCDKAGVCFQALHGKYALATGGIFGVGLGGSREKWNYLPEAHNDFIFAIIGEELGLLGTLMVLALFIALGLAMARIVVRHPDPFVKIATSAVATWVMGQALINIGVVIGVFPVIGLPLPLVSAGGSALVTTMAALGMVINFARHEPGAQEALAARPSILKDTLTVVAPRKRALA